MSVDDPRVDRMKEHHLLDILTIAICAVLCGVDHWTEMERFGKFKESWFSEFLELPNGIPSRDTFSRVFAALDSRQLQACFVEWVKGIVAEAPPKHIALDGKTLRRSGEASSGKRAIHMVSAYAHENGPVLTQCKVDEKSNEIKAAG